MKLVFQNKGEIMSKWLIATYAILTLLAAGFAKADQIGVNADLTDVKFEKSTVDFVVTGTKSNPCTSQVFIADQDGTHIRFRILEAFSPDQICTQQIVNFSQRIPVRELIYFSNLKIEPDQMYTLSVGNSPAVAEVLGSQLLH